MCFIVHSLHFQTFKFCSFMQRLHYVPGGHGSPGSPNRNMPWDFCRFSLRIQVWLRFDTFSHGLSRYPWRALRGRSSWVTKSQGRTTVRPKSYHDCQHNTFWPNPFRWDPVRLSRSVKAFYGWTWTPAAFRTRTFVHKNYGIKKSRHRQLQSFYD